MALIAQQIQSHHPSLSFRHKPASRNAKLGSIPSHCAGSIGDRVSVKLQFLPRAHRFLSAKKRPFMVLSFKENSQHDESDAWDGTSRFSKAPVQLSHKQEDLKEITAKLFDAQNHLSYSFQDPKGASLAIQELFKKWLIMLRTQTASLKIDKVSGEAPIQTTLPDSKKLKAKMGTLEFLQSVFMLFLRLDASISLPLVVFIPWFLTIRIVHGAEVTKELTPLWIIGPLVAALYIKIIKGICSLYVFCFMQAVKLVKNLPDYYLLAQSYIYEGQLKSLLQTCLIKPFFDIKDMDRKEFFRRKFKQLEGWIVERYADFIESIWPYYYRTIRFLKKANFI